MIARLKMNDILWYKTVLYNGGVKSFDSFIIRIYLKRRYPLHLPLNVTSDSLDHFFRDHMSTVLAINPRQVINELGTSVSTLLVSLI